MLELAQEAIFRAGVGMMTFEAVHIFCGAPHVFALPHCTGIMTRQAKLCPVAAQKGGGVAAVNRMAAGTLPPCEGCMQRACSLFQTRVTGGAHLLLRIFEQTRFGAGVGRVTRSALP